MVIDEYDTKKTCGFSYNKEQGNTNQSSMVQSDECPLGHMTKLMQVIYQIIVKMDDF